MTPRPADRVEPSACVHVLPITGGDSGLFRALERGDPRAPRELLELYAGELRRLLIRVLGNASHTESILRATFESALQNPESYAETEDFELWLSKIAVKKVRGMLRRRRWRLPWGPTVHSLVGMSSSDPIIDGVYATLFALPVDLHLVFALHLIAGMELEHIARLVGDRVGSVERKLVVARRRFDENARAHRELTQYLHAEPRLANVVCLQRPNSDSVTLGGAP